MLGYIGTMPEPIENLRKIRLEKLEKIRRLGVDPYPAQFKDREEIAKARKKKLKAKVKAAGRITGWRGHGNLIFADLKDESGQIQVCFKSDELPKKEFEFLELLDLGDFLGVEGTLFKTKAGELTILISSYKLLTKSVRPLPSEHFGFKNIEERYRQRYIDLNINSKVKDVFLTRTKIIKELRRILDENGFAEVETPVLQPIYGGATAKPFTTHHNALDIDLYLRISDELYLKRLIAGGFEKVYEIGKDFRNEGIDRQHNPEFTMLEFYWAYADYEDLMRFTEKMLSAVVKNVTGSYKLKYEGEKIDFKPPWERITFREMLLKDTRIDIDKVKTAEGLLQEIKKRKIEVDLKGIIGYAAILDELYKKVSRPKVTGPAFLIDHPCEMRPLAKKKADDRGKVASFALLVRGFELINAYNELNDPLDQQARWEEEMKLAKEGLEEHQVLDEDYIRALEYGMPPTAGWGLGIDRFAALLTNQHSLKDVILFPTLRPSSSLSS